MSKTMKVDDIKLLINTLSVQEFYNSYKSIIDSIFYTDNSDSYWDLLSRNRNKLDFDKILNILSPNGQLFDLILKRLTTDKSVIHYEFPISRLSLFTQNLIANNAAPEFIYSKLCSKIHGAQQNVLFLNAFEYYIFSFVAYIYHPDVRKRVDWDGSTDSLYCQLLLRYMNHFLFYERAAAGLMQLALQSRASRVGLSSIVLHSPVLLFGQPRRRNRHEPSAASIDAADWLYHTETLISSVVEFWFNSFTDNSDPSETRSTKTSSLVRPSVDQVCLVREFVKRCHHFCFCNELGAKLAPDCQLECEFVHKLHLYRRQIVPKIVSGRLLAYITSCFRHWPADLSFKIVLETWLSALQPWRYVDAFQHSNTSIASSHCADTSATTKLIVTDEWAAFINDQYELFTGPFLQLTRRFQRTDFTVVANANMVFRCAKVIAQPGLDRLLMMRAQQHQQTRGGSVGSIRGQQQQIDPIWVDIRSQMESVLAEIDLVLIRLQEVGTCGANGDMIDKGSNWWQTIWQWIQEASSVAVDTNQKRIITYLSQTRRLLADLFDIDTDLNRSSRLVLNQSRNDFNQHHNLEPEHVLTNRGLELTNFGRFQLMNKLCSNYRLDLGTNIDYYQRPVCSYEIGPLIRLCHRSSRLVCRVYGEQMRRACCRRDFIGRWSRFILIGQRWISAAGSASDQSVDTSVEQWVDSHEFQLRLRLLGSKAFLFWMFVLYLILRLFFDIGAITMATGGGLAYLMGSILYVALSGFQ